MNTIAPAPRLVRMLAPSAWVRLCACILGVAFVSACAPVQALPPQPEPSTPLTPAEIYAKIAPAVVYVETPLGTGSGLVTSVNGQTYVVTNEHVVWPDRQARIAFPDGTEMTDVPQAAADRMIDIALLGPIESPVAPVTLALSETAQIGDEVYLIGYPAEGELFPTPALARGLVSRTREWGSNDLTYIQTDAAIAGGQSGGVLVNDRGEVIGISGLSFGDGAFALAESSADIEPRLEILADDPYPDNLAGREIPTDGRLRDHASRLQNVWHTIAAVIDGKSGDAIDAEVEGRNDLSIRLVDLYGTELGVADDDSTGVEELKADLDSDGPVFLIVEQYDTTPARFTLHSNRRFALIDDPDDLKEITIGTPLAGRTDYPTDADVFILHLDAGQRVKVAVDAVMIDPVLDVMPRDAPTVGYKRDDDSGRGLFGTNAELVYRARDEGEYLVVVRDSAGDEVGGYWVSVTSDE